MTGTLSAAILVALGFFAQAKPPTVPEAPLAPGEVMLAGRKVALDFPADEPFVGTWGRLGGAAFAVGADGSVGARVYPEGFWQAAKSRFASFKPDPDAPPYHVKLVVATEAAILERRDDGTVVARRGNIASKQLDVLLAGVARFKALAEMEAGGKVNLAIDLMLDDDPVFLDLSRGKAANLGNPASLEPNPQSIARSLALGDLAPLVNDDSFETDDRVFRGPYESAFYVHPLLTPASGEYDLGRTPASVIPFFELGQARTETTFPLALLAAWRTHVAKNAARNAGLEASWDPRAEVSPAMVVGALRGAHAQLPASKTDPWTWDDFAGQAVGGEGSVRSSAGSGDLLAVRPDLAAHLADASPVGVLRGPMPLAVVRASRTGETEAQRLGMTLEASPAQGPYACGDFSLDADGVTITENPPGRKGFVAFPISRTGASKTLGLRISIQSAEDYALDLVNSEGKPLATLLLSERVRLPVEVGPPAQPLFVASVPADGQSHEIRVDLSGVPNLEGLAAVRFGPPPEGSCYERQKLATPKITIEDLAILGQASGVAPVPYAPPQIPTKTAEEYESLLQSKTESDRLDAIAAFGTLQSETAVPILVAISRSAFPIEAYLGAVALENQPGAEAKLGLRTNLNRGSYEHVERFAARLIPPAGDETLAPLLVTLHGSRSWQNRRVAVYSLGQIGTKAAQIMTLSFLYDRDPRARLEAVASVDVNLELACRRLLQTAVNDNSQVVRTAGFLRLTESSIDEYRQEGYKGVRDEALGVRLALLAAFVKNPNEGQRQAIRIAVVDREPIVRAAALEALAAQPGPVQIEEFSNVLQDQDPRVRAALEALGKAKNLTLP